MAQGDGEWGDGEWGFDLSSLGRWMTMGTGVQIYLNTDITSCRLMARIEDYGWVWIADRSEVEGRTVDMAKKLIAERVRLWVELAQEVREMTNDRRGSAGEGGGESAGWDRWGPSGHGAGRWTTAPERPDSFRGDQGGT